jgi:hypothetical protein
MRKALPKTLALAGLLASIVLVVRLMSRVFKLCRWYAKRAVIGAALISGVFVVCSRHPALAASGGEIVLQDIFGRRLNERGVTLVDWDGYMANPAIKLFLIPPTTATFPATAVLSANNDRLFFDTPSDVGANGPSKVVTFQAATPVVVYLSNFPDRDTVDGHYALNVSVTDAQNAQWQLTVTIHEIDQDKPGNGPFALTVDFSKDQTGFFSDAHKRTIVEQAASDWAYFFDDQHLDPTSASNETTFIWDPPVFTTGKYVVNAQAYTGFLLYAYGIDHSDLTSGGSPAYPEGAFQTSSGAALPLRRSGAFLAETQGNFNTLGWFLTEGDDDWWVSGNFGNEANDFYSIAHHEIGHALAFNAGYPAFQQFKQLGYVNDAAVLAYHGSYPVISSTDHMTGEIDNISRRGAFGDEYDGIFPFRRWLITKLDLLVAQAVGYKIRETSAMAPLALAAAPLEDGVRRRPYMTRLVATGGVPFYNWTIATGSLPPGLTLDAFTGVISGTPTAEGTYDFTVRVQQYVEGSAPVVSPFRIAITVPVLAVSSDFDRDGKTDIAIFRPSNGTWYITPSKSAAPIGVQWGNATDVPVPGDYDGDGRIDVAVFRPSNGTWYIVPSSTGTPYGVQWGNGNDRPVPADYDGDGKTDIAVFRPSNGTWYIVPSSTGAAFGVHWGNGSDLPEPADYDGDGKTDIAVFRPSNGTWYIIPSSTGVAYGVQWGNGHDVPVRGDYDGDGRADIAVFRPSNGTWFIVLSSTGAPYGVQWGNGDDIAQPGDYDGDGKTDVAIFRPSDGTWYVIQSSTGMPFGFQWGNGADIPVVRIP